MFQRRDRQALRGRHHRADDSSTAGTILDAAVELCYWGQVPVHVTIGGTEFTTSLFPQGRALPSARQGGSAASGGDGGERDH